ncbi:hypothetical protein M0805_009352 [Coniferiporia weirii]|nr:hypothetical protein M0805_009352 [Coniferiporia weirii]
MVEQANVPEAGTQIDKIRSAQQQAKEAITRANELMAFYANKSQGKLPEIKIRDKVLLNTCNLHLAVPSRKFANCDIGPYEILEQHGPVNYKLKLPLTLHIHPVFHSGLLIPYKEKDYLGKETMDHPEPELIKGDLEYEVEKILNTKKKQQQIKYPIKWKGYGPEDNTYKPLSGLTHAAKYVDQFHKEHLDALQPTELADWLIKNLPVAATI